MSDRAKAWALGALAAALIVALLSVDAVEDAFIAAAHGKGCAYRSATQFLWCGLQ